MSALDTQIDGSHYKVQKIQPIQLAYYVGGTPAFCKLAKYLTRDKGDRKTNLDKAVHCISLEEELQCFTGNYLVTYDRGEIPDLYPSKEVCYWIDQFSEEKHVRDALKALYCKDYSRSRKEVLKVIEELYV